MIRRPPRSTQGRSSAASDVYKRQAEGYRQREPAVLATTGPDSFYLNVNDSTQPPGTKYGPCTPYLLKFGVDNPAETRKLSPVWEGEPSFTDHSYRGFAGDRDAKEMLMLNIDAKTSEQNWCCLLYTSPSPRDS